MEERAFMILFVEENRVLMKTVRDVLEFAGWHVQACPDPVMARSLIESRMHYDLLLLANELSYKSDLELTEIARRTKYRQQTPVILISLNDCAAEAERAGANAFLRKPNNLFELAKTIKHLLSAPAGENI